MNRTLESLITTLAIVTIVIIAAFSIHQTRVEAKAWSAYYTQHDCHLIRKSESYTIYNPGRASLVVPERNTYSCDNGTVTIER